MIPHVSTILYTTTLGRYTLPVFRFAVGVARKHQAQMLLLHVVEPLSDAGKFMLEAYLPESTVKELHDEASHHILDKIRARISRFCADELGTTSNKMDLIKEIIVENGNPADVIIQQAERHQADLIVMGTEAGATSPSKWLGSTTRRVTLNAKKPVLVVPVVHDDTNQWPAELLD